MSTQPLTFSATELDVSVIDVIVRQLVERIGRERFDMWFGGKESFKVSGDRGKPEPEFRVVVYAESTFSLSRIKQTFGSDVREVVDRTCGPHYQIEYRIANRSTHRVTSGKAASQIKASDEAGDSASQSGMKQLGLLPIENEEASAAVVEQQAEQRSDKREPAKRDRNLKSFWFGGENRLAEAGVTQILEQPGQFSPFLIYGPTGCGKTRLLESILMEFRTRRRLKRCLIQSAEQFTSSFVASLRGGSGLPMFRRKYRDLDLLLIDDIQFLAGKRATIIEFQHTIDELARNGKQVIVSADRPPIELSALSSELGTRLNAGLSCPLRYPGLEGRVKIAQQLCDERQITFPATVIELICERLSHDVRRVSGALNRLYAWYLSTGNLVTTEVAYEQLNDLFAMDRVHSVSLARIESAVCELCGLKPADLKSTSRHKSISSARMLAMYLSRHYTSSAYADIGNYFGGRSHSTVIAAEKKVNQWLEANSGVALPHATYRAKDVVSRLESSLRIG